MNINVIFLLLQNYIFSIYIKNTCVVDINIFMTLFCTSIKGSVGLQPIGPIAPNWAPYLGGPELELSSLGCSSTHNTLQVFTENGIGPRTSYGRSRFGPRTSYGLPRFGPRTSYSLPRFNVLFVYSL